MALGIMGWLEGGRRAEYAAADLRFSMAEQQKGNVGESFRAQLDKMMEGSLPSNEVLSLGKTPRVLTALGVNDLELKMSQGVAKKAIAGTTETPGGKPDKQHDLTLETLKQIPEAINDPIAVFDSWTLADSLVIWTELKDTNGKSVTVALHLERKEKRHVINRVSSVYGRPQHDFMNWLREGFTKYWHKKKSLAWARSRGLRLPKLGPRRDGQKILTEDDFVNEDFAPRFRRSEAGAISDAEASSLFPEVDQRLKAAAKSPGRPGYMQRGKDFLSNMHKAFSRHFIHLDPKQDGAVINILREHQEAANAAWEKAGYTAVSFLKDLSPNERNVFTMNLVLADMIRDIDSELLDGNAELPFGYRNRDQVQKDLDHFQALAERTPAVSEALKARKEFMTRLRKDLVKHKLLHKDVLKDDANAYFHHQVLEYMNQQQSAGVRFVAAPGESYGAARTSANRSL